MITQNDKKLRVCIQAEEAAVHGRLGPMKSQYSNHELPLDPDFVAVRLDWKRVSETGESGLVFPNDVTGWRHHAPPLQQDWIRPAGWRLVECPNCGATPFFKSLA
jgi:integrase